MIVVLGTGSWGTALASVLAYNTPDSVLIWGRDHAILSEISMYHTNNKYLPGIKLPNNIESCIDLETCLKSAQDILLAIPSKGFVSVLQKIKPYIDLNHRIIWSTKGLEPKKGRFLSKVLIEQLGKKQIYAILSGPSFAIEVAQNLPTAITIATKNAQFARDLLAYFHSKNFRVYLSQDIIGIQIGGVIKNILSVATGISDGLGFGSNARAALITRGITEMLRFGEVIGAKNETLLGLAGIGDVVLTCTDNKSRNKRFGLAISKGYNTNNAQANIGQVIESIHNIKEVCKLAKKHKIKMPISEQILKILTGKITPKQAVNNLLNRIPVNE